MSKWLKLSEIPRDFWGECFIGKAKDLAGGYRYMDVEKSVVMVRNFTEEKLHRYSGVMWYCESLKEWFDFRPDLEYRLMIVEFPTITEEDFK